MRVLKDINFNSLSDLITFVEENKINLVTIIDNESDFMHIHTKDSFLLSLRHNCILNNHIKIIALDFSINATCYQNLQLEYIID